MADTPSNNAPYRLIRNVEFGADIVVHPFVNLYGCTIGAGTRIGPFVEIQRGATVGERCKIQSHSFVCAGVEIGNSVFVGHGTIFVNDKFPRATNERGEIADADDWELLPVLVEDGATIGSGALVLGGVRIGRDACVGAGAVVTRDVPARSVVTGVPARLSRPRANA